ncbi:NitT/TauT family transport system permease protein [Marinobacter persicus]|uniref:NitT/TauT family transport system permease protein n=1 Tax=Marinobacter persicus TaxID=930118 RepID=A0A1I3UZR3_9GAMM|nr:ABC transporter permease [Marinobacter persicus]GHD41933.1 lipid kinase [Marinobacter persicus]SFJ88410.1 NitT/TauT family transport system permease protein [Marinobacter persicus]
MRLINRRPGRLTATALGILPFIILLLIYGAASQQRLAENPNDKLLPGLEQMTAAVDRMAFQEDRRSGDYLMWVDTLASLERLGMGVGVAALMALVVGLANGILPLVRANLAPLVSALSMVPPLAILPILFIVFGLGELSKVMLIVIGTAPIMMRDVAQRVSELPGEQLIKIQTLGANSWQVVTRMALPQVLPRLIDAVRLSLGPAWLFLIAAEAIASTEGLGYRIFLVRRYLAMDVILPYVIWITVLAIVIDQCLRLANRRLFPWYNVGGH